LILARLPATKRTESFLIQRNYYIRQTLRN